MNKIDIKRTPNGRLIPTGNCWFCKKELANKKRFFCHGHDKSATSWIILEEYGSVAEFIIALGYEPEGKKAFMPGIYSPVRHTKVEKD